mgnify:CR=1 FL=1
MFDGSNRRRGEKGGEVGLCGGAVQGGSSRALIWGNTGQCWGSLKGAVLGQYWGQYWGTTGGSIGPILGLCPGRILAILGQCWGQCHASDGVHPGCTGAVPWQ